MPTLESVERPWLTLGVAGYNQERFIGEAIEGALAQTYSPLQIILSDDASTDDTFAIMQAAVKKYHGPHRLVVRRNGRNLGLCEHVNEVVRVACGQLFLCGAGDDISLPERAAENYKAWEDSGRRSGSIWSDYLVIDEQGTEVGCSGLVQSLPSGGGYVHLKQDPVDFALCRCRMVFGCTHGFRRDLFDFFGGLPPVPGLVNEDAPINFRSVLAGHTVTFIPKPLIKYRRHSQNISAGAMLSGRVQYRSFEVAEQALQRNQNRLATICECFLRDIETAKNGGIISHAEYRRLKRAAARTRTIAQLQVRLVGASPFKAFALLFQLARLGSPRTLSRNALRVLPYPWYRRLIAQQMSKAGGPA